MDWVQHFLPPLVTAFLASLVECIEALTVVLAVGAVLGWRGALAGTGAALALLLALVVLLGPVMTLIGRARLDNSRLGLTGSAMPHTSSLGWRSGSITTKPDTARRSARCAAAVIARKQLTSRGTPPPPRNTAAMASVTSSVEAVR